MTGTAWMQDILALELDARTKGIPLAAERVRLGDVGKQGWNVLRGDLMFPVLALRDVRMRQNLQVLRDFARHHQVDLAPHGKSTMCPQLYQDQIEVGGAWGITAATVQQCAVVAAAGVPNIIIANEVVGRANLAQLAGLKRAYPRAAIYSLVDSVEVVEQLVRHGGPALAAGARFQVLLELGYAGGRTGARTMERALDVLQAVGAHRDVLELAGIECYEGTINLEGADETIAAVDRFLDFVLTVLDRARQLDAFKGRAEVLLTAGGSSYFDRVAAKFTPARRGPATRVVLRGGSYLTYDDGFYRKKMSELRASRRHRDRQRPPRSDRGPPARARAVGARSGPPGSRRRHPDDGHPRPALRSRLSVSAAPVPGRDAPRGGGRRGLRRSSTPTISIATCAIRPGRTSASAIASSSGSPIRARPLTSGTCSIAWTRSSTSSAR